MKLRWTRPALNDLIEAQTYIAQDNPQAAQAVAQRLWDAAQSLADYPQIGRPGHVADTREWIVRRTPYLIVYSTGPNGNLTYKSDVGDYSYPASRPNSVRPHAVTSVAGALNTTYAYNLLGRLRTVTAPGAASGPYTASRVTTTGYTGLTTTVFRFSDPGFGSVSRFRVRFR